MYAYHHDLGGKYESCVRDSELLARGWVLQEWILSKRMVYFTPFGMLFECQTEGLRNERGEVLRYKNGGQEVKVKNTFALVDSPLDSWYSIVRTYSSLSLTKPEKDRVIAVAGIAREHREALEDRATAGKPKLEHMRVAYGLATYCGDYFGKREIHQHVDQTFRGSHVVLDFHPESRGVGHGERTQIPRQTRGSTRGDMF